ncbi:transporter substrate-binding domain-containing protein [Litoribrevibacter albus]|uniref:Amino acid ABC transporter substrate-binding protein n=1 Tax=Litoribrevibacter albus TaxID=1473156 RepID=A0AA37S7W9_9GAMM|nr:transporter substrate-binding domain-containing protein [Litoribrevibacter albus]GLQ30817.1 amino acid ABC transporter substrate-binding protein [Litoribrevibacter albus]
MKLCTIRSITHLLCLLFILCFSVISRAETISAAGDPWPPFLDPDEPKQGISLELVRAAFATQGIEVQMNFVPWARAIKGVKEADYDILVSTWYTEERTKYLAYSDPYLENQIKFIKRKGDTFEYGGLDSLAGKNVAVVRDYGYGDQFLNHPGFKRPEAKDLMTNIKKLVSSRVDLTLEDEIVARALINKQAPQLLDKIEFSPTPLSSNTLHVTVGLKNSLKDKILDAFNNGLKEIKANGVYDSLLKTHGVK